ncbi:MAG: VWA domain-containing protein, partial [Janthinobacterium lividum]
MRRVLHLVGAATMLLAPALLAQLPESGQTATVAKLSVASEQGRTPSADSVILHSTTQLVVVDVLVRDRNGNPVHGVDRDQFQLTEDRSPQTLRSFEEFSSAPEAQAGTVSVGSAAVPMQPSGTFVVDKTAHASGPLYILLVDALNTPTNSQDFLRQQLRIFLQHMPAGVRVAVFGLNGNLVLVQGFTADPAMLLHAVEQRMPTKSSVLLDDPSATNEQPEPLALMKGKSKGSVEQAGRATESFTLETRLRLTLDAFSTLGRYLSAFPGHKNLLWFSGSFPMNLIPDPGMPGSSQSTTDTEFELRTMTNVLARAQVSLYPVDARGIVPSPTFDAGCHCGKYAKEGSLGARSLVKDTYAEDTQRGDEHATMDTLANQTGGHAFYQTNDLAAATAQAVASGANYYTLSYAPANHDWNGAYRDIRVKLIGTAAARGYALSYRRGYFGTDPNRPVYGKEAALTGAVPVAENGNDRALALVLLHGAPAPADIPFKVRVLPASRQTEDKVVPGNHLAPGVASQGPFQRYAVDFLAPAQP